MRYLITLHLLPPLSSFEEVKRLPVLEGLAFDEEYGLVLISPKRNLYTIRVEGEIDPVQLQAKDPDLIRGVYGDIKISPLKTPN